LAMSRAKSGFSSSIATGENAKENAARV
jgi:hypothetical protein